MKKPLNPALETHMLFFHPAYMEMRPFDEIGPKHFPAMRGVEINEQGHAVFHYRAPNARSVEVGDLGGALSGKRFPMEKGEDGIWTVTIPQLTPGFHYHAYYVDGNRASNPQAPYGYGGHEVTNFIEVPDPDGDFYLCQDVPHGTVHMEIYRSSKTGNMHNVWIYTPASYAEDHKRRYPVLYLHHGGGENETGWIWQGKINYILDNLIAEGKCREMIVVMPCMYDIDYENPGDFLAGDYDHLLTADCMPLIERKYRILSDGMLALGNSMVSIIIGHISTEFVAANAIIATVVRLSTVFTQGLGQASSTITGNTLGRGEIEKTYRQGVTMVTLSVFIGIAAGGIILLLAPWIISMYNITDLTRAVAEKLMYAVSLMVVFQSMQSVLTKGILRGGGDTRFCMLVDAGFLWIASVPLGALCGLVWHADPFIIYIALKIDWAIKSLVCLGRVHSRKWMKRV